MHGTAAFVAVELKQGGLLIDDWTEVIPVKDETTGIAFNYNQPNAMPPQAFALAVPPKITWSLGLARAGRRARGHAAPRQTARR